MAHSRFTGLVGILVGGSLVFASTGAAAATSPALATQVSPWATLAGLSGGTSAAALCGSAVTAVQAPASGCVLPVVDAPPPVAQNAPPPPIPVPPVEAAGQGFGINPLYLALAAVAAGVGIYFLLRKHHTQAVSPA